MTDRPILFSGPMIRAILDGRKTQTRRVLKPQPKAEPLASEHLEDHEIRGWECIPDGHMHIVVKRLPYTPGDRLWVREQHYLTDDGDAQAVIHTADDDAVAQHHSDIARLQAQYGFSDEWAKPHLRIRPGIFMPRWASRLTLTVTDVRVQRVQEISEDDAVAEGILPSEPNDPHPFGRWHDYSGEADYFVAPQNSFRSLWDSINAARGFGWAANPWVLAITFDVHRCNIDQKARDQ